MVKIHKTQLIQINIITIHINIWNKYYNDTSKYMIDWSQIILLIKISQLSNSKSIG